MTVAWLTKLSPKLFYLHSPLHEVKARASMSCQGLDLQHSMEPSPSTTFGYFLHISCPDPAWLLFAEKKPPQCTANSRAIIKPKLFLSPTIKVVLQNLGGSPRMMTLMKIGTGIGNTMNKRDLACKTCKPKNRQRPKAALLLRIIFRPSPSDSICQKFNRLLKKWSI